MAGRTLTQQAMPTTLGMRASGWLAGVHDAVRTVRTCTTLPVSLGGPVGTAAAYGERGPAVLEAYAEALGQRAAVSSWHTRRTPVVGLSTAMTIAGEACGKIAADLLVMSQTEVGEAREGGGGASSSWPLKANPARCVLVAAAARQLPALASVIAAAAAPEQERPAGAWHAEWQPLRGILRLAGASAERTAVLLPEVRFDHDSMRRNLDLLVKRAGEDAAWVDAQTAHVDVWIDRVLTQHQEVFA
jgi:3-carboxy-cis,cis-muconate cycloisomerase